MMGLVVAIVWDSAWVRVRRLTAGPVIAANTQAQTSRASTATLPAVRAVPLMPAA
jgi:hypothetical protein